MKKFRELISIVFVIVLLSVFIGRIVVNVKAQDDGTAVYLPLVLNNYDPAWEWQAPITVTLTPATINPPVSAIDGEGRLHLIWSTLYTPRYIYHTYYDNGAWTEPSPVAETLGYSKILYAPLVDERGNLHLVWHNDLGSSEEQPYRLMYSQFDGETWSSEEEVYRTKNSSVQAMPHRDLAGNIYISLLDGFYSTVAYQLAVDGSEWMTSDPINPGHLTQWTWPDMMGGIHFFGSDYQNKMYYSYWRDGHFLFHNWQTGGTISGRQTQLDGQNNLHTFWTESVPIPGGTVRGLYYQCLQSDHNWASEKVLSGSNYVLGLPIKAANTYAEIALAWEEKDTDSFALRRWRKCEMISQQSVPWLLPSSQTLQTMTLSNQPHRLCVVAKQDFTQTYSAVCAKLLDE